MANSKNDIDAQVVKMVCGLVMPISELDGCTETHWTEVQEILSDSIEEAGFDPNLVSNADDAGLIHKRIIQNLYENPMVVCDVSGKNPNVMFELGLRLAFDKPTIIVKDDKTTYSFDTAGIEHLEYPRDLRFTQIVDFKKKLSEKIHATHQRANSDPDYTTFLKHFGEFKIVKLDRREVSPQEFILAELKQIRATLSMIQPERAFQARPSLHGDKDICMSRVPEDEVQAAIGKLSAHPAVSAARIVPLGNHQHIILSVKEGENIDPSEIRQLTGGRLRPPAGQRSAPNRVKANSTN